jgi:GNAT superfamily N-acetyltransferase
MKFSYILFSFDEEEFSGELLENEVILFEIFVEEKKRGSGFSKELMNQSLSYIKDRGFSSVVLHAHSEWCGTDFSKLKRFYQSFGFTQIEKSEYFRLVF